LKTTLVVPDIQHPYHDQLMLDKIIRVARDLQPDAVLQIGDGIDFPQVSRWSVGTAGAYAPTLQAHITGYCKGFLEPMAQAVPNARLAWLEGNHDARLQDFVGKYAPALSALDALSIENLFSLREYGWSYVKGPVRVGTNTYAIHGHEAPGYSASLSAWDTKFTKRYGSDKSYVFGHTHQPGIVARAYGWSGKVTPRWTMNVGSVMDPEQATYVKDGSVSWQMSFAILRDDGKRVYPELVLADNRSFYAGGVKY